MQVIKFNLFALITLFVGLITLAVADDDFEIKSLSGEPNYRSVNLTWGVEELPNAASLTHKENLKRNFMVYYCEIQTWGPNRCKSKVLKDDGEKVGLTRKDKFYSMLIDNLRMATKYSFHIKKQNKPGAQKPTGRDMNEEDLDNNAIAESIVIPTKGFSAHATKCLAHASEIEVETGPYFGGKIASENGFCGVKGDPKDSRDTYTMQIDHEKCGSNVNHENLTVETFITVQENLGIFTHSTRRFLVLCTYHPEMLTVRASFSVPGRGGATAMAPDFHESDRNARGRHFRLVDKTALVLKENDPDRVDAVENLEEIQSKTTEEIRRQPKRIEENFIEAEVNKFSRNAEYAPLVADQHSTNEKETLNIRIDEETNTTAVLIAMSVSGIMLGAFVFIIFREIKKQRSGQVVQKLQP